MVEVVKNLRGNFLNLTTEKCITKIVNKTSTDAKRVQKVGLLSGLDCVQLSQTHSAKPKSENSGIFQILDNLMFLNKSKLINAKPKSHMNKHKLILG